MKLKAEIYLNKEFLTITQLSVDEGMIVQDSINQLVKQYITIECFQENRVVIGAYFDEYQLDRYALIEDLFDQGDIIKITITQLPAQTRDIQKQQAFQNKQRTQRIELETKQRKKKIRKKRKKNRIIKVLSQTNQTTYIQNESAKLKILCKKQKIMLKIINFIDQYLLFSYQMRKKQFLLISEIEEYYQQKVEYELDISLLNSIVKICPQLYKIDYVRSKGYIIKFRGNKTIEQRKQIFLDCLSQNSSISQPTKISKPLNISSPISISRIKRKIQPLSILHDKQFSSKMQQIILLKQQQSQQKLKQMRSKRQQYCMILQQIQLFRTLKRINVNKKVFLKQISKRTNCSQSILIQFLSFVIQNTNYIQQHLLNNHIKIVVNIEKFKDALVVINKI